MYKKDVSKLTNSISQNVKPCIWHDALIRIGTCLLTSSSKQLSLATVGQIMQNKFSKAAALLAIATLGFSVSSYAETKAPQVSYNGFYIGAQGGYSNVHPDTSDPNNASASSVEGQGVGGTAYAGYEFNKFLALEGGYGIYTRARYNRVGGISGATGRLQEQTGDLVVKGILPIVKGFGVYGKGGVGYVDARGEMSQIGENRNFSIENEHAFTGVFAGGVEYAITPNLNIEASWTHYLKTSNTNAIDLGAVGLDYHFG